MDERRKYDATERQARIIALLKQQNFCSVNEINQRMGVSSMTIRRDLRHLADQQIVDLVHGGARLSQGRQVEPDFALRTHEHVLAKQEIGACAATFIEPGDVIGIDGGSTVIEVVRNLPHVPLTIVTHSLAAAELVAPQKNYQLLLLGGMLNHETYCFSGPQILATLRSIRINKLFLTAAGLHIPDGLSSSYLFDAEVKQAMIQAASEVILCMDSSKFGKVFLAHFASLDAIDVLVTDNASAAEKEELEAHDIEVIIASPNTSAHSTSLSVLRNP